MILGGNVALFVVCPVNMLNGAGCSRCSGGGPLGGFGVLDLLRAGLSFHEDELIVCFGGELVLV